MQKAKMLRLGQKFLSSLSSSYSLRKCPKGETVLLCTYFFAKYTYKELITTKYNTQQ